MLPTKPNPSLQPTRRVVPPPQQPKQPPPARAYWPEPPAPKRRWSIWQPLTYFSLGWLVATLIALLIAAGFGLRTLYYSDWIAPGVYVDGLAVGGLTRLEALTMLEQAWPEQPIKLEGGGVSEVVTPEMLGIAIDTATTVEVAYQQGRTLASLREWIDSQGQVYLPPVWYFDPTQARNSLKTLAPHFEVAPVDAGIQMVQGQVEIVPSTAGRRVDIETTLAHLAQHPTQVAGEGKLTLAFDPVAPALHEADLSQVVEQANGRFTQAVSIRTYDPIKDEVGYLTIEPETWSEWYNVTLGVDDPAELVWYLDSDRVRTWLMAQNEEFGERYLAVDEVSEAIVRALATETWTFETRFYYHDRPHTVQPGETLTSIGLAYGIPYPWIEQANPNIGPLRAGMEITVPSPDVMLSFPVVEGKRIRVSIGQQRMWVYESGQLKWEWPVSTGIDSSPTAPGLFQIQSHDPNAYAANWNLWMPHFMGIYRPVPASDFMNGFHGFPTRNGANLLWTDALGRKVTYGCILISSDNAKLLYEWAEEGVVVEVTQ